MTGSDPLATAAANPGGLRLGALLVVLAGIALALVPVVFWPIGRRHDETLAMGYVVFRGAIETVIYIVGAIGWLVLIPLSTQPDTAPIAGFLRSADTVIWSQLSPIVFALGALMFYILLYRSRLVPRWLSGWGLVGATLYTVPAIGSIFGVSLGFLMAPLAVQEMALAVWLIARGFDRSALAATPAEVSPRPSATPRAIPAT